MKIQPEDKKSIKQRRMVTYFVDAAKEIIINEGVEKVSVRKVADLAGYSYATIYNYFDNLNDLLRTVKEQMIVDLVSTLQKKTQIFANDKEGLVKTFEAYMAYFFDYPNVFTLFFLTRIEKNDIKKIETVDAPNFDEIWAKAFLGLVEEKKIKVEEIDSLAKTIIYVMHGILTLSFSGNGEMTREIANQELEKVLNFLLK